MAKIAFQLPGGRGVLQGQDAQIIQAETVRKRAQELPPPGALCIMGRDADQSFGASAVGTADGDVLLCSAERFDRILESKYARLWVHTASVKPGATAVVALFRLDIQGNHGAPLFRQIGGTLGSVSTETTGMKTITLPRITVVSPTWNIYVGIWSSDSGVKYTASGAGLNSPLGLIYQTAQETLPAVISDFALTYQLAMPAVAFLCESGRLVL